MTTAGDDELLSELIAIYDEDAELVAFLRELQSLRAAAAGPGREETIALDTALCNYTNWVDDFGDKTDPDYCRVFDALCAAYNGWHEARKDLTQVVERPQSGSAPRLCNSGQSLREEGPATKSPVEADVLREARDVVEADNRNPGAPGSHSASRARLARALLAMAEKPQS